MLKTIRKIGYTVLSKHFYTGIAIGFVLATLLSIAQAQSIIETDQAQYLKQHGEYFVDVTNPTFKINTYEKTCKGYFTVMETPTTYVYTGYGDLKDEFTYEIQKDPIKSRIASTTKP